jgi:3-aminobutyryl-CoA ammonia-lyase
VTAAGSDPRLGLSVTHRRYVPYSHAHYAGELVDGAYVLGLFGDVATEVCIRTDGDEGLFAAYSEVQFQAPVRAGDVLEATATVVRVGNRSRTLRFECRVVCRGRPDRSGSAAEVVDPPLVAVTAVGTVVVPGPGSGGAAPDGSGAAAGSAGAGAGPRHR